MVVISGEDVIDSFWKDVTDFLAEERRRRYFFNVFLAWGGIRWARGKD